MFAHTIPPFSLLQYSVFVEYTGLTFYRLLKRVHQIHPTLCAIPRKDLHKSLLMTRVAIHPRIYSDVPSLDQVITFYENFYERSQMEIDTIIMSLIYVEKLIKETNGLVVPGAETWKCKSKGRGSCSFRTPTQHTHDTNSPTLFCITAILFSCMVLASKVWDDLSMWNVDFSNVSSRNFMLASFTLRRINELELAVLKCLNFIVRVPASEYAKYYFLIRCMLMKSGDLNEGGANEKSLDMEEFKKLEALSSNYQAAVCVVYSFEYQLSAFKESE